MINRPAKIIAYNYDSSSSGCEDFSMNVYWGAEYKNVFYIDGSQGRSEFETIIETKTDITGQTTRTQNTSIEKYIVSVLAISPLLPFLHSIDKCDVKQIEYLDTGEVYTITNIDIDDQGSTLDPTQLVYITFEDEPISKVSDIIFSDDDQKLAYWDNNDDGTQDIDGEAEYQAIGDVFNTWQLYFESDGVTPATSGDVIMLVYSKSVTNAESLVGIFEGQFGDSFSDSSKWQSVQSIWDYFNLADTVGHTNRVQFDKRAFAEDNGYFSDELEERAVDLRFELKINGSDSQATTLSKLYTVWGGFNIMKIQKPIEKAFGIYTIGKVNNKNTLNNFQDIKIPFPSSTGVLADTSVLVATNNFSNTYQVGLSNASENYFDGVMVTRGGYSGRCQRGSFGSCNFTFGLDQNFPILQDVNILNFTTGNDPHIIGLRWLWERDAGCGGFPTLQDIAVAGDAKLFLNGVLVTTFPAITPSTVLLTGLNNITLPDTEINTITFEAQLTSGYFIRTEFEAQLKALY
jgi:hypothetical protein